LKLDKRLRTIANLVPKNSIVADIGTDHGYVPKYLIDNEIAKLVIASDVSEVSLAKTAAYVEEENLADYIIPRIGSGLEPIKPFEVDTVIIAGMGGILISEILRESRKKAETYLRFILQPMVGSDELRRYLIENKFKIVDEDLVREDGRYYEVIVAENGLQRCPEDVYLEIGPILIEKEHQLWREFVEWKISVLEAIVNELEGQNSDKSLKRLDELSIKINKFREVLRG
jgi:tRNA (adenine22-N1)-methyltransferase